MAEFGFFRSFYFVKNTWFFKKIFPCKNIGLEEKLLFLTFFDNFNVCPSI